MKTRTQLQQQMQREEQAPLQQPLPVQQGDVFVEIEKPIADSLRYVAQVTAPDLSLGFVIAFVVFTYFHESYFKETAMVLGAWLVLQLTSYALNDDFKNDLFWSIFSLFGNVVFYLFLGYIWSMFKLYMDVWQGHLDPELILKIRTCVSSKEMTCIAPLLLDMKWIIVRWMTTWPISLVYTLARDPLHIITDLLYHWSRQRYFAIMASAINALDTNSSAEPTSWTTVFVWFGYILAYVITGYAWTHLKLFIEVWQGALPQSLDAQVREVYNRQASYWEFVKQIKWHVTQWMITWPISVVYTILRHPLRILADFIYELSHRKYMWIVGKAMALRMKKDQ